MGSSLTTDITQHGVSGASCMMLMPVLCMAALFVWGLHFAMGDAARSLAWLKKQGGGTSPLAQLRDWFCCPDQNAEEKKKKLNRTMAVLGL